ncbi:MAG: hypothetical protein KC619_19960 [Myxococcales bacterium]|nr:hypothetical protein [Myxococcales bacterium]
MTRDVGRAFVARHHSHHRAHVGHRVSLGAFVAGELVAVVVLGNPVAGPLDDGATWEVTRHCCGPMAPRYAASRLLGHATRLGFAAGLTRLVSYTRVDERGSCYLAANWTPVEVISGRPHDSGNRAARWLPGLEDAVRTTEVIDRVRWEIGPRAGARGARWDGARWVRNEGGLGPMDDVIGGANGEATEPAREAAAEGGVAAAATGAPERSARDGAWARPGRGARLRSGGRLGVADGPPSALHGGPGGRGARRPRGLRHPAPGRTRWRRGAHGLSPRAFTGARRSS